MIKYVALLLLISLTTPSLAQNNVKVEPADSQLLATFDRSYFSQEFGFEVPSQFNALLYDTLENWLGTPYRYAGNAENGIDCSGFVCVLFDRVYGQKLGARNSGEIYSKVEKIDSDDLVEGDLVFFSQKRKRISHIGMYLGNNKFVHSSTSKGVIVSDLNEPYYKKHFAGAGRTKMNSKNMASGPVE